MKRLRGCSASPSCHLSPASFQTANSFLSFHHLLMTCECLSTLLLVFAAFIIGSNLRIAVLNLFCSLKKRFQNLVIGNITRESVKRALANGITAEQASIDKTFAIENQIDHLAFVFILVSDSGLLSICSPFFSFSWSHQIIAYLTHHAHPQMSKNVSIERSSTHLFKNQNSKDLIRSRKLICFLPRLYLSGSIFTSLLTIFILKGSPPASHLHRSDQTLGKRET